VLVKVNPISIGDEIIPICIVDNDDYDDDEDVTAT